MTKTDDTRSRVLDLMESLEVGEAIPSERQLSQDLAVSRLTIRAALDELVRDGYLDRRHGSGTYVTEPKIAQPLTLTVLTIDQPNMTGRRYCVNGEVKYEGVEGMGYLETVEVLSRRWAVFHPDAGRAGPDDEAHRHVLGGYTHGLLVHLAERQRDFGSLGVHLIEVEHFRIPVCSLFEIRAAVGNVIDQRDLERRRGGLGLGAAGCCYRGGRKGERFDETAAADPAAVEIVKLRCNVPFHVSLPLLPRGFFFDIGELHGVIERIEHVHVSGSLHVGLTGLFQASRHARLIPVRDGVADVIDEAGCRRPWIGWRPGIARNQELAAFAWLRPEHQIGAAAVVFVRHALHAEMVDVEVAHLGVVRAAVGDVIDAEHLQAARRLRLGGIAHRVDAGGERDGLAELAAVDPAALEVSDEISNEAFHAGPPLFEA